VTAARRAPAPSLARSTDRTSTCDRCHRPVLWARTWHLDDVRHRPAWIPLDPDRAPDADTTANVAVSRDGHGSLLARVLPDGGVVLATETRGRVHMATCPGNAVQTELDIPTGGAVVIPLRPRRQGGA
jgi:hypothetical protein